MSATARAAGTPDRPTHRNAPNRTSTHRTSTHRTGVYRVRGGTARSTPLPSLPVRSVGHRATASRSVPVRPDLRLVTAPGAGAAPRSRRAARSRHSRARLVVLVLVLLVGTTLSLLVLNTATAVDSLQATSLRQENAKRAEEIQRLQQQVVEGSTPQRLAGEATAAGMVPAGTAGYLVVEPDGSSTLRGTPAPAPETPPATPTGGG